MEKQKEVGPPRKELRQGTVHSVAFSPDGKRLAAAGDNQHALTWDLGKWNLAEEKPSKQLEEHNGTVRVAAFSPDGTILATGSIDNTVLLSDARTGRPLGPLLTGHRGPVVALAFRADGTMLASGSEDRSIVLWDVKTRQQFGPRLTKHVDAVRALEFSADGKQLISVSSPEDVIVWDLDSANLAGRSRDRANRNLTEAEWQAYMEGKRYRKTWPELPKEYLVPPEN
jgi:WD40 repeat protein